VLLHASSHCCTAQEFNIDELAGEITVVGKPDASNTKGFISMSAGAMLSMADSDGSDNEEEGSDEDAEMGGAAGSADTTPKFAMGGTQRKGALAGQGSVAVALSAVAAGYASTSDRHGDGSADAGGDVASQMGLGSGSRTSKTKGSFLDAEEKAAGNLQVQQARRASSKADKRKSRKEGRRASRGEAGEGDAASTEGSTTGGEAAYDFKSFF
jgi:hypothetical protein